MARNGAGAWIPLAPVVGGTIITSTWANNMMTSFGADITESLDRTGRGGMLVPFRIADGSEAEPGYSWTAEQSTGFYRDLGGFDMRVSVGGVDNFRWNVNGAQMWNVTDQIWEQLITDSGTPGQVAVQPGNLQGQTLYWDQTGDMVWKRTNLLHVDVVNNRVGIGVVDPTSNLEVSGNIKVRSANSGLFLDAAASNFNIGIFSVDSTVMEVRNNNVAGTILLAADAGGAVSLLLGSDRLTMTSDIPDLRFTNSTAAAEEGHWGTIHGANSSQARTLTDVGGTGQKYYQVNRTGIAVTLQTWSLGDVQVLQLKDSATADLGTGGAGGSRGKLVLNSSSISGADAGVPPLEIRKNGTATAAAQHFVYFYNGDTNDNGAIVGAGAGAATFGSQSDRTLKENITPLLSMWNDFKALNPVEFDYIDGRGHQVGFIAQDVQEIWSDYVAPGEDGLLVLGGLSRTDAKVVKVIQELIQRIEVLENG